MVKEGPGRAVLSLGGTFFFSINQQPLEAILIGWRVKSIYSITNTLYGTAVRFKWHLRAVALLVNVSLESKLFELIPREFNIVQC
jgi:hypothetical protein